MSDYKVARLDEIEGFNYRQQTRMQPVRHHLGITAFGTNAWTAEKVGDRLFPEHAEDEGNEELYVVVRGRARFELGRTRWTLPPARSCSSRRRRRGRRSRRMRVR